MVIDNLNVFWAGRRPFETDSELVIDPNAVLSYPIASECLQSNAGWNAQIVQLLGGIDLIELASSNAPQTLRTSLSRRPGAPAVENILRPFVPKRPNHDNTIARMLWQVPGRPPKQTFGSVDTFPPTPCARQD